MADDMEAPHVIFHEVSDMMPIKWVIADLLESKYLPRASTWSVEVGVTVAVIAYTWPDPRYLIDPDSPLSTFTDPMKVKRLYFQYHGQDDPGALFQSFAERLLRSGGKECGSTR
jgi:hypothetical protein